MRQAPSFVLRLLSPLHASSIPRDRRCLRSDETIVVAPRSRGLLMDQRIEHRRIQTAVIAVRRRGRRRRGWWRRRWGWRFDGRVRRDIQCIDRMVMTRRVHRIVMTRRVHWMPTMLDGIAARAGSGARAGRVEATGHAKGQ